jgi:hypothetical protein
MGKYKMSIQKELDAAIDFYKIAIGHFQKSNKRYLEDKAKVIELGNIVNSISKEVNRIKIESLL